MSDADFAAIAADRADWMVEHRGRYLSSGGAEGHIMDLSAVGGPTYGAHCLIKYIGRKSGKVFITPLCYSVVGGEVTICGSKGGADEHPAWYLNLIARPEVEFQVATQAWRATWREPEGAEREKAWAAMVDNFAFYANYQASTSRRLPLVMMKIGESIPVFTKSDMSSSRQS